MDQSMYQSLASVSALNRSGQFNPAEHLRYVAESNARMTVLPLDAKKRWFQTVHPGGRLTVKAHVDNTQLAIVEGAVYLPDDAMPLSNFFAIRTAAAAGSAFMQAAQAAALDRALTDAGFGIQFCDILECRDPMLYDDGVQGSTVPHTNASDFDAQNYLRSVVKDGQDRLYLDLKFKKLWFRLMHKDWRLILKPLHVTGQIAAYEGAIYQPGSDAPVSTGTGQCGVAEWGAHYLEIAQCLALNGALCAAGFGAAVCVSHGTAPHPMAGAAEDAAPASDSAVPTPEEAPSPAISQGSPNMRIEQAENHSDSLAANAAAPDEPAKNADTVVPFHAEKSHENSAALQLETDTPVRAIAERLTYEDAAALIVDFGICRGWTLQRVLEERPASLRYYVNGYSGPNNLIRAAASILLDHEAAAS